MIDGVVVEPHAFKHGLSESEIKYAWSAPVASRMRGDGSDPPRWIVAGWLPDGRLVQMVGVEDSQGRWHVFHAMTPVTKAFLKELGMGRE